MTEQNSVFATLSTISVKDKIERKGNLDYLSWANAWAVLKNNYPDAQRKVYESDHTGFNYFTDGKTAWVKVGIIVNDQEHIDYLPIMDYRNNAIPIEKITSTDVNKAIQRSTAKAIAMHGLGLSLWTGEDVPELVTILTSGSTSTSVTTTGKVTQNNSSDDKSGDKDSKITLRRTGENWAKVVRYVETNKSLGVEKLFQQLQRKYTLTPAVKNELTSIINTEKQEENAG